jgi:hypothetical protein
MKCPKCSYVSFDYHQICPKCSKDISSEQKKLNLPTFKPSPPSLLNTLTGEASESHVDLHPDELEGTVQLHRELGLDAEDLTGSSAGQLSGVSDSEALELRLDAQGPEEMEETVSIDRGAGAAPSMKLEEVPLEQALLDLKTDEAELLADAEEPAHARAPAEDAADVKGLGDDEIELDLSELETRSEPPASKDEESFFAELKPEDLEETPREASVSGARAPAERKMTDDSEMVTLEIEKARDRMEKELEDLDLEMDLETPSKKGR